MSEIDKLKNFIQNAETMDQKRNGHSLKEEDKMAIRINFIRGIETFDSSGLKYDEWDGFFKEITGREITDAEFMDFNDWWEKKGDYEGNRLKKSAQSGESIIDWMLINKIINHDPRKDMGIIKK